MNTELAVRIVRLASARADLILAQEAFGFLQNTANDDARYHFFTSMVTAYCRPFPKNTGIRSLLIEYPNYPDWPDKAMNLRHENMMDLRNRILAHSSIEGTKVRIVPKGAVNPRVGKRIEFDWYDVAKRFFHGQQHQFAEWLYEIIPALNGRVNDDVLKLLPEYLKTHPDKKEAFEITDTPDTFDWSIPKGGQHELAEYGDPSTDSDK